MGLNNLQKFYRMIEPPPNYECPLSIKVIVVAITVLLALIVLCKVVEFLHSVRRENSKAHYRVFLALSTAFLLLLVYVVADFVGPRISKDARSTTMTTSLIFALVFVWMYRTCNFEPRSQNQVQPNNAVEQSQKYLDPYKTKSAKSGHHEIDEDLQQQPPQYGDLYPPSYSAAVRGERHQV